MNLTTAQLTALKNDILADPTLSLVDHTSNAGYITLANAYNVIVAPTFFVYRSNVPTQEIFDQILWANFTPTDAPDTTVQWSNRSLAAQGKQFNLQTLLVGSSGINANRSNIRAGLQDALTNLPTGAGGATLSAGWVGVRDNVLARAATRGEKLFATVTAQNDGSTAAKAASLGLAATTSLYAEGVITVDNISAAFN